MTADGRRPPPLAAFEKLGAFYLGRTAEAPYLYDAKHLTTHAVVIGMTGSGKTGLSIALLEEAAIDGIPAIVVDPKGDLGNLLLTFPALRAADFAPWVPAGVDPEGEARRWREGLAEWGQDGARIERLRAAADVALYTPGSRAGRPLSILGSLAAPTERERADADLVSERIVQTATSLLGLVGVNAEPGKSREHVLVAKILERAWAAGEDLDLAGLVRRIQDPPFERIGVLDVESFYPKKERFDLAVAYNGLLAAPGFEAWLEGPPLDVASLLFTSDGRPRVSILSIAHLGDAERMFFVSLLLGQLVAWMRTQPGTPVLRAVFFMDEVAGYLPPVAVPPSKPPLLLLLKQARAFGLGVVLATQNPVDLDYKALSNAGSWFIGRLQTERDKARVLDGLEGAAAGAFDRATVDRTLSSLKKREFFVNVVHDAGPVVVETRFAMSYLRGPLSREETKRLAGTDPDAARTVVMPSAPDKPAPAGAGEPRAGEPRGGEPTESRPVLPPDVPEVFLPTTSPRPLYRPFVLGAAHVQFADARTGLDFARDVTFLVRVVDGPVPLHWEDAKWAGRIDLRELAREPAPGARFVAPPSAMLKAKSYGEWSKRLVAWLAETQGVLRWRSPDLKIWSEPNEDERAFRARLLLRTREQRDVAAAEVRAKYAAKLAALEERIRRVQHAVADKQDQASAERREAAIGAGGGLLGAFFGGRSVVAGASRAAKGASRAAQKERAAAREKENLDALLAKHGELSEEARAALSRVSSALDPATAPLERVVAKPKRTGIDVRLVALAWRADT